VDIDTVADELYGLRPEEFTATRTAREKEAKAAGDKRLATQIHSLAKPNQVAWLANLLVREHPDEVRPLLDLGAGLRETSEDVDAEQLREFSRQQHQLLRALVQQARRAAVEAGGKVTETAVRSLEDTLRAALVDPDAAQVVLSGRLVAGLQHSGFGPGTGAGTASAPIHSASTVDASKRANAQALTPDEVARADREVSEETSAADDARRLRDEAAGELERASKLLAAVARELSRLQADLDRAESERSRLESQEAEGRTSLNEAARAVEDAEARLTEAAERRQALAQRG